MTAPHPAVEYTRQAAGPVDVAVPDAGVPATTADRIRLPQWLGLAATFTVTWSGVRPAAWTLSDYLSLATAGVVAGHILLGATRGLAPAAVRRGSPTLLIGLITLTVGGLLATMLRSFDAAGSALVLVRLWYITIVWFWTLRAVTNSIQAFQRLLLAAMAGGVVNSLVGIYQDVSGANAGAPTWGRSPGLTAHVGELGMSAAITLPLLVMWRPTRPSRRAEVLRIAGIVILLGGIASSGAMTAFGSALVAVLVTLLAPWVMRSSYRTKRRLAFPLIGVLVVVVALSSGAVEFSLGERFSELMQGSDTRAGQSAESRAEMAEVAINEFVRSPLVGVGMDLRTVAMLNEGNEGRDIHSVYLGLAFEAGVLGLLGLLVMMFVALRQAIQLLNVTRGSRLSRLSAGLLGMLIAIWVVSMFGPILYGRIFWFPTVLVTTLHGIARASIQRSTFAAPDGAQGS
jgi:hypothetical protein